MANINMLPPEILLKIFGYFDIKTLFKFRLVCKEWKNHVACVKILELVFEDIKLTKKTCSCEHELLWYEINKVNYYYFFF